ncbi:hypothetical protein EPUS_02064 [Endocarpon pusillum Z07020]|uniref:Uncharacterized protein n=1 Tax=Endocarpon pusillum (strain Z07020 / HMAS-L-300199) TaxID=1263415 RepID=U1GA44_ENDPU|nr:uncharacterized protein EPUS_02064 [Endocarpon pusillum Z07020]ERF74377.1 hypothetical protein EPUS_02064 [Endocarpon pusillum Z07020]
MADSAESEPGPRLRSCCAKKKSPELTPLERARRGAEAVVMRNGVVEAAEELGLDLGKLSPGSVK